MSESTIIKNFKTYKGGLIKLFGEEIAERIIEALGGEEKVSNATYANSKDSGAAYNGAFIKNVIRLTKTANELNNVLPEEIRANVTSINKVCMLSQIAKVQMFKENDNNYEIINRGILYKFETLSGALRTGERSTLIASNAGVVFSEVEYEAMRAIDNLSVDDNYTKFFSSPLSLVIRQAYEIINLANKVTAE